MLSHDTDARSLASIKWSLKKDYIMEEFRARHKRGIMARSRLCPPPLKHRLFPGSGGEDKDETHFAFEDVFLYHRLGSGYQKVPNLESEDLNNNI
jgi:hypothetical protein